MSVWAVSAVALAIGWLITPFAMILIANFGEHRHLPLWRGQARAFFPGDLLLGFVFACGVRVWRGWNWWWLIASVLIGALIVYVFRYKIDRPYYDPRAFRSPTKLYHDFVCYGVYGTAIVFVSVPALFVDLPARIVMIACVGIFAVCAVYDAARPGHIDRAAQHPVVW